MEYNFKDVTLLITHYNRSRSLERLLYAFRNLNCRFDGIVVSDDGSKPEHAALIKKLQEEFGFQLVSTPKNKGLGNNINKGQDAVQTPYTLYVQEDFEPTDIFPQHFPDALQFMEEDKGLDTVRFYAYFPYPLVKPAGKGYSEMVYSPWCLNHIKFYYYSDHPHLRRSNFLQKFGRYPEGKKVDKTEYGMAIAYIQKRGRGLLYDDFTKLFYQKNSPDEPSTVGRSNWRGSKNPFVLLLRGIYLKFKFIKGSWDVQFMKT